MEPILVERSTLLHLVNVGRAFIYDNFTFSEKESWRFITLMNNLKAVTTSCIIYSKETINDVYAISMRPPDAKQYFLLREPASEMHKPKNEQLFKDLDLVYDVKRDKNGFSFEDVTGKHRGHVAWDYELAEYTPENYTLAIERKAQYEAYHFLNKFIKKTKKLVYLNKQDFGINEDEPVNWIDAQMKANEQYEK